MTRAADRRRLLSFLYGSEEGPRVAVDVERLIAGHRRDRTPSAERWDERDAWLITYPDQFRRPGEAPLVTLHRFLQKHLEALNGVHILPFFPWSSDDGFAITDYERVDPRYGTWDDVERIARHRRLMVDAVVNHMSVESDWFRRFLDGDPSYAGLFRTADPEVDLSACVRPRTTPLLTPFEAGGKTRWVWTTFSTDQADLDYRNPGTLLRVLAVLLGYARHGADVIRLDAVGFLWKEEGTSCIHLPQTHALVRLFRACLDDTYPDVILVTETNVPHRENVSYFGDGSVPEAQMVYQFALAPLTLHAITTGDVAPLRRWAAELDLEIPGTTFLSFLGSHDGVGLRPAEGLLAAEDIGALTELATAAGGAVGVRALPDGGEAPYELDSTWFDLVAVGWPEEIAIDRHLATHAVMLAIPGVPAVYVHSLFGTSNDVEEFHRTGIARRLNRHRFADVDGLEKRLGDVSAREHRVLRGMRRILRLRASHPAFHPDASGVVLDLGPGVFGVERVASDGRRVRVLVNLSAEPVRFDPDGWRRLSDGVPATGTIGAFGSVWLCDGLSDARPGDR